MNGTISDAQPRTESGGRRQTRGARQLRPGACSECCPPGVVGGVDRLFPAPDGRECGRRPL